MSTKTQQESPKLGSQKHVLDSYYPKLLTLAIIKTFSGGHRQKLMHLLPTVGNQHWDKVCQKSPE